MADGAADLPLASHVSQSSLPCDACAAGKSHCQLVARTATYRTIHAHRVTLHTCDRTLFIGADSPLARCHIGEGEISILFPDVAEAKQLQLHDKDSIEQLDHEHTRKCG